VLSVVSAVLYFRWHAFLEFLSRVRPSNTGLPIPVSKRPLEYAKHYPEPGPNWPRTDADTEVRYIQSHTSGCNALTLSSAVLILEFQNLSSLGDQLLSDS